MQLFLDCDGVLADFDQYFIDIYNMTPREYEKLHGQEKFWYEIEHHEGGFFYQLSPMPDAFELVEAVKHLHPIILTGAPRGSEWPKDQKEAWRDKYFPDLPMIVCQSKNKFTKMVDDRHNILIDDWPKYKHVWENAGGTFIVHTSAENSINELKKLGVL